MPSIHTEYYERLGVKLTNAKGEKVYSSYDQVSTADIRKAYHRQAVENHPDKKVGQGEEVMQAAKEKFQLVTKAYEILMDPQKRAIYDQYGEEGLEGGAGGPGGMHAEDLFSQFFGGGGGGGGFGGMFGGGGGFGGGGMREQGPSKARTIHHVHKVSLEDIYRGKVSKLALQKSVICTKCEGRGGKEGAAKTCTGCQGRGRRIVMRQMGPMIQRFEANCSDCDGEGVIFREKDKCKTCNGKKTVVERKVLHVHVDRGVQSGAKIDFYGEGDQIPGAQPGDVQFEIEQKPHARFQRKGDDLFYHAEVDLLTALAGGAIYIEHLDDRWLTVELTPGEVISQGEVKVIRGQGMPSYRHHDFGNLYIQFDVKFPEKIVGPTGDDGVTSTMTAQQIKALESVLPPRAVQNIPPPDAMTEDYTLEKVDPTREGQRSGAATDDDDEDMPQGGERVQCASQ